MIKWLGSLAWTIALGGCALDATEPPHTAANAPGLTAQQQHGLDVWMTSTFGGEQLFSEILPAPPFDLTLGLDVALTTPRAQRFAQWGLINDPDCVDGDASTGYFDICTDPNSAGVIGVRKLANTSSEGPPVLIGVACAGCHAGFCAQNPPADPAAPTWANIDPTIGNQYVQLGKIFAAHLPTDDPRAQVFHSWEPGTVDITAIEDDHITNPSAITPIYEVAARPYFELHHDGVPITAHRSGQGGEDDVGCELAALREYFNLGMCAAPCMIGHLSNGAGGTQTPIDLDQCAADCPDFVAAEQAAPDVCAFLDTALPPRLPAYYIDASVVARGQQVFEQTCAGCHSNGQPLDGGNVLSDDLLHPALGPSADEAAGQIGTNTCRSRTTNWQAGHIWAAFSSDEQKARGPGYYRDVSLVAAWATAPFFHNNRLGTYTGDPSTAGRLAAYDDAISQLLDPSRRDRVGSTSSTTGAGEAADVLVNSCPDPMEDEGHSFGALLSDADKHAVAEFLKTR